MGAVVAVRANVRPYVSGNIRVYTDFKLTQALHVKMSLAMRGTGWTLFVNSAGTIAHAVHKNGVFMRIEGAYYLEGCKKEYIINFFFNKLKELIPS